MGVRIVPQRHISAELLPALLHVDNLLAVFRRFVEQPFVSRFLGNRNLEARHEVGHRFLTELLFLVSRVPSFGRTQAISLYSLGQDHGRTTLMFGSSLISVVHLLR